MQDKKKGFRTKHQVNTSQSFLNLVSKGIKNVACQCKDRKADNNGLKLVLKEHQKKVLEKHQVLTLHNHFSTSFRKT